MSQLSQTSGKFKNNADILLQETDLISQLKSFGDVFFSGAYAGNVMMHGDIDITVVRENPYLAEEVLDILKFLYLKGKFRSYFIKGDWDDSRKGAEFPHGHYIGLKQRLGEEKWKVDIWFVGRAEFEDRKKKFLNIGDVVLTGEQRELILSFKKYRNDHNLDISGQEIYDAVLNKSIKNIKQFIKTISKD
ncbi:MAG: hypothetical protein AAB534_02515 [Patescibacteria group bacterium]